MKTTATKTASTAELRVLFSNIRKRSSAESATVFNAACAALLEKGSDTSPLAWVRAAERVTFLCRRCAGTGSFITYVENGQPKGPGGVCFRCNGKGCQNDSDARRNYGADMHQVVRL